MASVVEQDPVGTQTTGEDETFAWRKTQYLEMGFSVTEAEALANSQSFSTTGGKNKNQKKLTWRTPLHWLKVKTALDNGCTKAQALEIFVTTPEGL